MRLMVKTNNLMDLDKKIQSIQAELNENFYVKVDNLDLSKEDLLDFSYRLGEVIPSGSGHDLVDEIISTKDTGEAFVRMHNDKSYWIIPPRYLVMYIKKFEGCENGETILSDMYKSYRDLDEKDQKSLMLSQFVFTSPKNRERKVIVGNIVNLINQNNYFFRYRLDLFENNEAVKKFDENVDRNSFDVKMLRGDLIIIDNWRFSHGRQETLFSDDGERVMYRTLVF